MMKRTSNRTCISVNSPIARGLIGKEQDDVVTIRTPGGEVEYEIIKVEYL